MEHHSRRAGKQTDLSTEWSEWIWSEEHGYSYCTRTGPTGELEYDYHYPEEAHSEKTPRTVPVSTWPSQDTCESAPASSVYTQEQYTITGVGVEDNSGNVNTSNWIPNYEQGTSGGSSRSKGQQGYTITPPSSRSYGGSASRYNTGIGDITQQMEATSLDNPLEEIPEDLPVIQIKAPGGQTKLARQIKGNFSNNRLDDRYVVVDEKKHKKFWKPGRVFMMLWTEPARSTGETRGSQFSTVWLGERVFSEIRRFVIIGEGHGNAICSPIHTYSGQATLKANLPEPQQHAIVYTTETPPDEYFYQDEDGNIVQEELTKDPIRVKRELEDEEGDLGKLSRINYSKIYTVEKYVRILNIGKVHENSMDSLLHSCFFARPEDQPPQGPRKHSSSNKSKEHHDKREGRGSTSKHHRRR